MRHSIAVKNLNERTQALIAGVGALALGLAASCTATGGGGGGGDKCGPSIEAEMLERCARSDRGRTLFPVPKVTWAARASQPPADILLLELTSEQVTFDRGDPIPLTKFDYFLEELDKTWALAESSGDPKTWALVIASDAPRGVVAKVFQALDDVGRTRGFVMLDDGELVTFIEEPSEYDAMQQEVYEQVSATPAKERTKKLREEIQKRAPTCFSVNDLVLEVAGAPLHVLCRVTARDVAKRLVACGCPASSGAIASLLAEGFNSKLPSVVVPVTLDKTAQAQAGATWAEIVDGLEKTELDTLWVDAAPPAPVAPAPAP